MKTWSLRGVGSSAADHDAHAEHEVIVEAMSQPRPSSSVSPDVRWWIVLALSGCAAPPKPSPERVQPAPQRASPPRPIESTKQEDQRFLDEILAADTRYREQQARERRAYDAGTEAIHAEWERKHASCKTPQCRIESQRAERRSLVERERHWESEE